MTRTSRTWWKTALGIVFTALMLFPVYWMLNVSLTRTQDLRLDPPHVFPVDPTLEGFEAVLRQQLPNLGTSLLLGLGCVALTLVIAAPAGYAMALLRLRGQRSLNFVLLVAQMIPAVVMAMGFYAIYVRLGVLNTLPGLIVADSTVAVPFAVLLFTAFMSGIPRELVQAATIDGAGVWRVFRSIVLPMSRPILGVVSVFAVIASWKDFLWPLLVLRDPDIQPLSVRLPSLQATTDLGVLMAALAISTLIPVLLFLVFQRLFLRGAGLGGAVKG